MTEKDVAELIRMNFALYKLGAKPLTDAELKATSDVWLWHFRKYPAEIIKKAFLRANAVCHYPIQAADIFDQLKNIAAETETPAEYQWRTLKEAVHKADAYASRRACPMIVGVDANGKPIKDNGTESMCKLFRSLPQSIQNFLGSESALVDLTRCGDDELDTYRRNEFMQYLKANSTPNIDVLALPANERMKQISEERSAT